MASTRSWAVGDPPRWMCPSVVTRVSKPVLDSISRASVSPTPPRRTCPNASVVPLSTSWASPFSVRSSQPSLTTTIEKSLPFACRWRDQLAAALDRHRPLGRQDDVGAAGHPRHDGDPPGMPAHHLADHHPVVRLGGRVQAVDRLGRDRDRRVEPERVVGAREVVVDRLGDADDVHAMLGMEPRGDAERVLSADGDERVELLHVREHALDAAVDVVGVRPRGLEDRPAAGEDPGDVDRAERAELALDEPPPPVQHADHLVAGVERAPRNGADDGVQPGAVASAREDPDPHRGGV